jgi:hypothetical protein
MELLERKQNQVLVPQVAFQGLHHAQIFSTRQSKALIKIGNCL